MKVSVKEERFKSGEKGYSVAVLAEDASVQDYLDALNQGILTLDLFRVRGSHNHGCKGCDACCAERMPLTLVDLIILAESPVVSEWIKQRGLDPGDWEQVLMALVRRFCRVYAHGSTVDITLALAEDGKCPFLDRKTGTCGSYDFRPLVCQAYICCPVSGDALSLRESVVNAGEDEFVRRWLSCASDNDLDFWFHEGDDPQVNPEDWKPGPFTGKESYAEVLLKDVVSEELWRRLKQDTVN